MITSIKFHIPILPIDLEIYDGKLAFVVICHADNYNSICEFIESYAKEKKLNFFRENSWEFEKQYVWFFPGTQYYFYSRNRTEVYYTISVEFNKDIDKIKFGLLAQNYLEIFKKKQSYSYKRLNKYGILVFGCLYKYTNSYIIPENFFTSIYNNKY